MRKTQSIAEISASLATLKGPNIANWLKAVAIFQGRALTLFVGTSRLFDFKGPEGPKALRERLEQVGIPMREFQTVFEAITDRWIAEPFTGELRVDKLARKLQEGAQDLVTLITLDLEGQVEERAPIERPRPVVIPAAGETTPGPARLNNMVRLEIASLLPMVQSLLDHDQHLEVKRDLVKYNARLAELFALLGDTERESRARSFVAKYQRSIAKETDSPNDWARALACHEASIPLVRDLRSKRLGMELNYAGTTAIEVARHTTLISDWEKAEGFLKEALQFFEAERDLKQVPFTLSFLAQAVEKLALLGRTPDRGMEAIQLRDRAITLFEKLNFKERAAFAALMNGHSWLEQARKFLGQADQGRPLFKEALDSYTKAERLFVELGIWVEAAKALGCIGGAYTQMGGLENRINALAANCKGAAVCVQNRLSGEHLRTYIRFAGEEVICLIATARKLNSRFEARGVLLSIIDILKQTPEQFGALIAEVNGQLLALQMQIARSGEDPAEMVHYLELSERAEGSIMALSHKGQAHELLYSQTGNPEELRMALEAYSRVDELLILAPEESDKRAENALKIAMVRLDLAFISKLPADFLAAVEAFDSAERLRKVGMSIEKEAAVRRARARARMAIAQTIPDYEKVRFDALEASRVYRKMNDWGLAVNVDAIAAEAQTHIARISNLPAEYQRAVEICLRTAETFHKLGNPDRRRHFFSLAAEHQHQIARASKSVDDYNKAIELKQEALKLAQEIGKTERTIYYYSFIGEMHLRIADLTGSIEATVLGLESLRRSLEISNQVSASQVLA